MVFLGRWLDMLELANVLQVESRGHLLLFTCSGNNKRVFPMSYHMYIELVPFIHEICVGVAFPILGTTFYKCLQIRTKENYLLNTCT